MCCNVLRCQAPAPVLNGHMPVIALSIIMIIVIGLRRGSRYTAACPKGRGSVARPRHGAGTVVNIDQQQNPRARPVTVP
jgi:hypothetical protein